MLGRCSHEFSWPRRAANGEYYQVCLLCAAEYKYDWKTMRRIERVEHSMPEPTVGRNQSHSKKSSWVPRARRLKLQIPLRYRVRNLGPWSEGKIGEHQPVGCPLPGTRSIALECSYGNGLRDAGSDLWAEEEQRALPRANHPIQGGPRAGQGGGVGCRHP